MTAGEGPEDAAAGLAEEDAADIGGSLSNAKSGREWRRFQEERGFGGRVRNKKAARRRGMDNNGGSHHAVIAAAGRSPDDVAHGFSHRST
jgi:hypothetical protein